MPRQRERTRNSNYPYLIGLIIGLILLVIIAIQNSAEVALRVLAYTFESSLSLFLAIFFILGWALGLTSALVNLFRKDRQISRQASQIQELEQDNENLRQRLENDPNF
jgi:uncharacterized integral membrane protein